VAPRLYYGLDTRMDSVLLGCLVGLLAAWDYLPRSGWPVAAVRLATVPAVLGLAALTYAAPTPDAAELYHGVELLACVAVAIVLVALVTAPPRPLTGLLEQPALVWVGQISYGLYLWHLPVFRGVLHDGRMARLGVDGLPLALVRFVAAFVVAALSFYLLERPMLRLKERFRRDQTPPPSSGASRAVGGAGELGQGAPP
jgi:peptidoglycan/LPS O-acetylase OafA/YrhL